MDRLKNSGFYKQEPCTTYYQYFTGQEKLQYHPYFVYSITMKLDDKISVFLTKNVGISFPLLDPHNLFARAEYGMRPT